MGRLQIIEHFYAVFDLALAVQYAGAEEEEARTMEMLLMGACLSMFGLAVTCLAFGAATRPERSAAPAVEVKPELTKAAAAARFFVQPPAQPAIPVAAHTRVPLEVLLLQIENHVRLEQAAVESFLQTPTSALLHSRTISTLVN